MDSTVLAKRFGIVILLEVSKKKEGEERKERKEKGYLETWILGSLAPLQPALSKAFSHGDSSIN